MDHDFTRLLRDRIGPGRRPQSLLRATDRARAAPRAPRGSPRLLGQVVNMGAMPTTTERVFLVNPVRLDGSESEGSTASVTIDKTRTIPVVVVGHTPPSAGDLLLAHASGGRWVADRGAPVSSLSCSPCPIPRKNLTVSWTNYVIGSGSAPLVYSPPGQWNSGCVNQLLYSLGCPGSLIQFSVTYFLSGSCPGGQQQSCSSPNFAPFQLVLATFTCSPLYLRYTLTTASCPELASDGYTAFTITE